MTILTRWYDESNMYMYISRFCFDSSKPVESVPCCSVRTEWVFFVQRCAGMLAWLNMAINFKWKIHNIIFFYYIKYMYIQIHKFKSLTLYLLRKTSHQTKDKEKSTRYCLHMIRVNKNDTSIQFTIKRTFHERFNWQLPKFTTCNPLISNLYTPQSHILHCFRTRHPRNCQFAHHLNLYFT